MNYYVSCVIGNTAPVSDEALEQASSSVTCYLHAPSETWVYSIDDATSYASIKAATSDAHFCPSATVMVYAEGVLMTPEEFAAPAPAPKKKTGIFKSSKSSKADD